MAIIAATWCLLVLIVPFMELKLEIGSMVKRTWPCLNRTFYGIETISGRCEICTPQFRNPIKKLIAVAA